MSSERLSDKIEFVRTLGLPAGLPLLAQWQSDAKKLEGRVASAEQQWVREMQDLSVRLDRQKRLIDSHFRDYQRVCQECAKLERKNAELTTALANATVRYAEAELKAERYDNLKRMYDTDITARNADVRQLSKEREELKEKLDKQAKVFLARCDGLVDLTNKMERQIHDLIQQRDSQKQRNNNQSVYIREYQEEVRKLREQVEAEKTKPPQIVRLEAEITGADFAKNRALGMVTGYGPDRMPLFVFKDIPINGLTITIG